MFDLEAHQHRIVIITITMLIVIDIDDINEELGIRCFGEHTLSDSDELLEFGFDDDLQRLPSQKAFLVQNVV